MKKILKNVFKNTSYLVIAEIINKLLFLILVAVIARFLGTDGMGDYGFIFAVVAILFPISGLGLKNLTIRTIARDKSKTPKFLGGLIIIRTISFFAVFIFLLIYSLAFMEPTELKIALILGGLLILSRSYRDIFQTIFRAYEKLGYQAILDVFQAILTVSLGLLFLFNGWGLISLLLAFVISDFIVVLAGIIIVHKKFAKPSFKIDFNFWLELIKKGGYFWMNAILFLIVYQIDIIMIYFLKGNSATGIYKAASDIVQNIELIPALFSLTLYPAFSNLWKESKTKLVKIYNTSLKYMVITSLVLTILVFILAKPIILIIYGSKFIEAITALRLISITIFFTLINYINIFYLFSINKQKLNVIFMSLGAILNIALNILLIPSYGITGAIYSSIISIIFIFILKQRYIIRFNRKLLKSDTK